MTTWREVGKQRKRILRKRGESIRFSHTTSTGKSRYIWERKK